MIGLRSMSKIRRAATGATLLFSISGCQQRAVCENVSSPCLALSVDGDESFTSLELTLSLLSNPPQTHSGDISPKGDQPSLQLPATLEVLPPDPLVGLSVREVELHGLRDGKVAARAVSDPGFLWPAGQHAQLALTLRSNAETGPDGGSDMHEPAPLLTWRAEPTGQNVILYGVWAGGETQTYAVGERGTILGRDAQGKWIKDSVGGSGFLAAVTGRVDGTAWTVGQGAGAWRKNATSWVADASGLNLGGGGALYAAALGATDGELWAGDNQGRVWHRTGSSAAAGIWQPFEQVFPVGAPILGVASAGGAVFIVGIDGRVAVRPNSLPGTLWDSYQYGVLPTGGAFPLSGVVAFDKDTAIAVGAGAQLVRYTGGVWNPSPQVVSAGGQELLSVWGMRPDRVWVVGSSGLIARVEGSTVLELSRMAMRTLYSVYGRSEADIYAVGAEKSDTLILHGTP